MPKTLKDGSKYQMGKVMLKLITNLLSKVSFKLSQNLVQMSQMGKDSGKSNVIHEK